MGGFLNMNKKLLFILLFILVGSIALQIPFTQVVGSKANFTLFDFFAPIAGGFLGSGIGIISVFIIMFINLLIHGFGLVDKGVVIRLFPILFGVWFFAVCVKSSKSSKWILTVPILSIIIFNLHPIGRTVWFYSLYWFIPLIVWPFRNNFLLARSLGATFTIHAVGGAIWIWAFNLPAVVWISLIPIVALERIIFALGISASYILFNNLLALISKYKLLKADFSLDKRYILKVLR